MLETIREYAMERLEASGGAEELLRRHAEWFVALAEEARPHIRIDSVVWLDVIETEHDNIRRALDTFEASGDGSHALQLSAAVASFWNKRGHIAEGRDRLEKALRADERPTAVRARALALAGVLASNGGDNATGRRRLEEALALAQRVGDDWSAAYATLNLGGIAADEGDLEHARRLFEESIEAFSALGDDHLTLWATRLAAWMYYDLGDHDRARDLHQDVVRRARATGADSMAATSLGALAEYALNEGRVEDALPMLRESTRVYGEIGDLSMIATNLCRFALAWAVDAKPLEGAQMLARAEALFEEAGRVINPWIVRMNDLTRATVRTLLDEAAFADACEQGRQLTLDEALALVLDPSE